MPRPRKWTDEQLASAVSTASSWLAVTKALGINAGGATYAQLRRRSADLGLDTEHLPGLVNVNGRTARRRFSDDELCVAVRESATYADVMRKLGYEPSGGMHRYIRGHIKRLELETAHFVGQAWAKGRKTTGSRARPLEDVLVDGSTVGGADLLRRLIRAGYMASRCQICGRAQWRCRGRGCDRT